MEKTREKEHNSKPIYSILYINGEPHKLKQLRDTEAYPNFGITEEKEKVRGRTNSRMSLEHDTKNEFEPTRFFEMPTERMQTQKTIRRSKN